MNKAIITVVGQDTVGIIARVCTYLSEHQVNVLDISQTIIDGFFNMMMIVDYSNAGKEFGEIVDDLDRPARPVSSARQRPRAQDAGGTGGWIRRQASRWLVTS